MAETPMVAPVPENVVMPKETYERVMDTLKTTNEAMLEMVETQKELRTAYKHDPVSTTPNSGQLHGINPNGTFGLFAGAGVNPRMYQTIVKANADLHRVLPRQGVEFLQVRREILTGVTSHYGQTPATSFCTPAPNPGDPKICRFDSEFGELHVESKVDLLTNMGSRYTIADVNREIVGDVTADDPFFPDAVRSATDTNSQLWRQMMALGQMINLDTARVDFQGVAGSSSTDMPSYQRQYDGIERLVRTSYTDVVSGSDCTALASRVTTWNAAVSATVAGFTIVDAITNMFLGIQLDMEAMGNRFDASQYVIVMNRKLWRPVVNLWPIAYATTGNVVQVGSGVQVMVNAVDQRDLIRQMYQGKYLLIDGLQIPVMLVDGNTTTYVPASGVWTSSIFVLPLFLNGQPTLYYQFFNMNNSELRDYLGSLTGQVTRVTNGGMYLEHTLQERACVQKNLQAKIRLLLDAPFAAGRIDGVQSIDPLAQRSPFPDTSGWYDGGVTQRTTVG